MGVKLKEVIIDNNIVSAYVLDSLEIGIFICLLPHWVIAYANAPAAKFLGRPVGQLKDLPLSQITEDTELSGVLNKLKGSSPRTKIISQQDEQTWSMEWYKPEPPKKWPPNDDMAVVVVQEISENRELDAILDCVFDGIWIIDSQGITVRVNKALEKISNIKAGEVIGRHVLEPRDEGKFAVSVSLKALEERRTVTMLDEYATGKRCLTSSIPVFNEQGKIWQVVSTIRDITQLEELHQELLQAQKQARIYHDKLKSLEEEQQIGKELIGSSPALERLIAIVRRMAKVDSTALILGETGAGKSLVAKAIHNLSSRADASFIAVNCGAIPETLIESELFGYEKGSFTGAKREGKPGMFELAQGGTIFLDEVAELPLSLQVKLLQAVEEHTIYRIGGTRPVKLDMRIIAATNRNLEEMVSEGTFREDLYYRLKVLPVVIPPLRERKEDVPLLVMHFLKKFNEKMGSAKRFSREALDYIMRYQWPGNVRELRTVIEHAMVMAEGDLIIPNDLPLSLQQSAVRPRLEKTVRPLQQAVQELEKNLLSLAIKQYQNSYKVAEVLQISQSTVIRKAKKYGLSFHERSP